MAISAIPRAFRLQPRRVEKPWGCRDLGPWFAAQPYSKPPIGEIWFEDPRGDSELLVKLLFTSARLSVQVHPDDAAARAAGLARGKDEAWVVLDARPPAEIAIGLRASLDPAALRQAALDGTIVGELEWAHVAAGDAYYSPAGTVHAIGAGLMLLEVQQHADVTYRLYDYGSDRGLDLDAAVAVSRPGLAYSRRAALFPGRELVASGPKLQIERLALTGGEVRFDTAAAGRLWLFAATAGGRIDDIEVSAGDCIVIDAACVGVPVAGTDWLIAYAGPDAVAGAVAI